MRRRFMRALSVLTLAGLASCVSSGTATPPAAGAQDTQLAQLMAYAQGGLSALVAAATQFGVQSQGKVATAFAAASQLIAGVAKAASSGIVSAAKLALGTPSAPGISSLVTQAAQIVLQVLSAVPGASAAVAIVNDVISIAPSIAAVANNILNPTAVSAPAFDNGAAARLGILA